MDISVKVAEIAAELGNIQIVMHMYEKRRQALLQEAEQLDKLAGQLKAEAEAKAKKDAEAAQKASSEKPA